MCVRVSAGVRVCSVSAAGLCVRVSAESSVFRRGKSLLFSFSEPEEEVETEEAAAGLELVWEEVVTETDEEEEVKGRGGETTEEEEEEEEGLETGDLETEDEEELLLEDVVLLFE